LEGVRREKNPYPDRVPGDRVHDIPPKLRDYLESMAEKPAVLPKKKKNRFIIGRKVDKFLLAKSIEQKFWH